MSNLGEEKVIFTVPDPGLIGPRIDRIDVREGNFEVLTAATSFVTNAITTNDITVVNATVTNLNVSTMVVAALGANAITPSPPGSGVIVDGVLIRDQPHYAVANRSVSSFEGINPLSTNGVSVAIVPLGTGAIIGSIPDGTAIGGNTRGNYSVDFQLARSAANQVASGAYSVIIGGSENVASGQGVIVVGGSQNAINESGGGVANYSVITGGSQNIVSAAINSATWSTISGGRQHSIIRANYGSIGGGYNNEINYSDNSVISGGAVNVITGGGVGNNIAGGANNTIQCSLGGEQNSSIGGGLANQILTTYYGKIGGGNSNTIQTSTSSVISGGSGNLINQSPNSFIVGGNSNRVTFGQQSGAMGWNCDVIGTYAVGIGYQARPVATGAHVFASYPSYGGANTAADQWSGNFIYDTIRSYVFTKEIHNFNTEVYYGTLTTTGPTSGSGIVIVYVFPEQYSSMVWNILLCGAGGNDGKAALGRGWVRMYKKIDGTVDGTGIQDGSFNEDSGFGFAMNMGYSGGYAFLRVTCGVGAGVKCNWTVCIQVQKASRLIGI